MQVLHECKDAHDDHFANCTNQARQSQQFEQHNHLGEVLTEELLHEHLQQISNFQSDNIGKTVETALTCMNFVEDSGFFSTDRPPSIPSGKEEITEQGTVCVADAKDNELEVLWQQTYEQHKLIAKNVFMNKPCQNHNDVVPTTVETGLVEGMNIDNESTAVQHPLTENEYEFDNHFSPANRIVEGNMMLNLEH